MDATHTVCLTFDFDAISVWLHDFEALSPSRISRGEFGVVGAKRILALLDEYGIKATWFVPGHTADTFPVTVAEIAADGHEVGHHGYCHESPLGLGEEREREILRKGIESLRRITGERPAGYRSPSWDLSPFSIDLLLEHGFAYDSSLMANDSQPYWCRTGDQFDTESAYRFGTQVPLVEMPITWGLDDWPAFEYVSTPTKVSPGLRAPDYVLQVWAGDFNYMVRHIPGGVLTYTMHPQVIGRGHRMLFLERLIQHIRGTPGARFMRLGDYVAEWKASHAAP
jgi:peptidoglycan/xylan/chitin deacetylase (PgdA/CDA1 family)